MTPPPSTRLSAILAVLCEACERAGTDEISYSSEWLGWLPYGAYHWVDVGSQSSVEERFPDGWEGADLDALLEAGCLERLEFDKSGDNPQDIHARYRLTPRGRELGQDGRADERK